MRSQGYRKGHYIKRAKMGFSFYIDKYVSSMQANPFLIPDPTFTFLTSDSNFEDDFF